MTVTRLIIARHGNTFGPGDTVTRVGKTDLPLVDKGLEQGRLLGEYLREHSLTPDAIFSSHLKRTIETAEQAQSIMGTALPIRPLDMFNEIDYGPDENKPEEDVIARVGQDALNKWDEDATVPQGWLVDPDAIVHAWKSFAEEMLKTYEGKTVLVVTSNGIARFAPHLTGDFDVFRACHKIKISTGALSLFEHDGQATHWTCRAWNLKPKDYVQAA